MKKLLIITIIVFNTISIFAQTQKFDVMTFTPPKGWQSVPDKEAKVFAKIDKATNSMGIMSLYPSIDSTGNAEKDFKIAWEIFVKKPYGASDKPEMEASQIKGFAMISGGEIIQYEGIQSLAILTVLSGNGRLIILLTISNEKTYLYESTKLIEGMSFDLTKAKVKPVDVSTTLGDGEKFDLWMSVSPGAIETFGAYTQFDNKIDWKIVYPNGDYYPHLPMNGFLNFSRANSMNKSNEANSWGRLVFSGNNGRFQNKYENVSVTKVSATKLKKVGYTFDFYKVASVDNLTLSGAYSLNFKDSEYSRSGCRRVIHFSKDSRFDDRGIFVSDCSQPNAYPKDSPGKGTYQLKNFTIILQYDNGRTVTKAFSGVADKPLSIFNEVFYLGGNPFFKN